MTNIMPAHVKISIEPGIRELFLNEKSGNKNHICIYRFICCIIILKINLILKTTRQHMLKY
jgi:hypothetical protein